jgi:hypothetical protein
MTIAEVISKVDALKPNTYTQEDKVEWLSTLDSRVMTQIIDAHEGGPDIHFYGYDGPIDQETELLVPAPYDEMYLRWLEAMIDYHNSDDDRYNNAIMLFNNAYEGYKKYYTRTHMPKSGGKRFIF